MADKKTVEQSHQSDAARELLKCLHSLGQDPDQTKGQSEEVRQSAEALLKEREVSPEKLQLLVSV